MNGMLDNDAVAVFLVRTVTGILFFFQAYDKIYNVKLVKVAQTFSEPLGKFHIPYRLLLPLVSVSSFIELVSGILLFFGLFSEIALYLLSANMLFVAFAFSSVRAMWDMQFFFPRLILITFLLFTISSDNAYSLDHLLFHE